MRMYILELFADERKLRPCDIAGYYTSKAALVREMKKHLDEIGEIYDGRTVEEHAAEDFRYFDSELAGIEFCNTNSWTA